MALWLFKEEPDHYSFADLQRDGKTLWDGVANALARQHLRNIKRGDRVLYYHTGKEKAVVGILRVVTGAKADPTDEDPKAVVVEVAPVQPLVRPVPLSAIKADPLFKDWALVAHAAPVGHASHGGTMAADRGNGTDGPEVTKALGNGAAKTYNFVQSPCALQGCVTAHSIPANVEGAVRTPLRGTYLWRVPAPKLLATAKSPPLKSLLSVAPIASWTVLKTPPPLRSFPMSTRTPIASAA